jgi:hypothetical protein
MIRGRAAAGDTDNLVPLAARPQVLHALRRAIVAVGVAGLSAALLVGLGDDVMSMAARAAVTGGGVHSSGSGDDDATVTELAASDPVEAAELIGDVATTTAAVTEAAFPLDETSVEELVAAPIAMVTPAPPAPAAPAPAPAPAPGPVAVSGPPAGSVEEIILEVFGEHGQAAIGVARCESGLNPGAISRGGGNWGLFQINKVHRGRVEAMGYRWEDVLDARVNTLVAHAIFSEQGWSPWGCRHAAR